MAWPWIPRCSGRTGGARSEKNATTLVAAVHEAAGEEFNVNSTQALASVLFDEDKLGLTPCWRKPASGARSTARRALERFGELATASPNH